MSYPPHGGYPDDGYGQQPQYPGYGYEHQQPSGYQQPDHSAGYPTSGANAGYHAWPGQAAPGYPTGAAGPPHAPQPPRKSKLPFIVLSAVAGVLVISVVMTLIIVSLKGKDDDAPKTTTASGSESSSSTPDDPTPTESEKISTLTYLDMMDDWTGSSGREVTYMGGMDYSKCTTFISGDVLTKQGCESAVELSFEGEDGELKAVVFFLVMADEEKAKSMQSTAGDENFRPRKLGFIEEADDIKLRTDSYLNVTVLTCVTATKKIETGEAKEYAEQMASDMTDKLTSLTRQ